MSQEQAATFKIGPWFANLQANTLNDGEREITLEPKMMDVLAYLAEHANEVVSAEQLLIDCWKGTFYGDAPVHKCIAGLRKSLGCNARNPSFIETVFKRGYKIIAPVTFNGRIHSIPQSTAVSWTKGNPYLGLKHFEPEHAPVYFGRSKAIAALIRHVQQSLQSPVHFLLLSGKSGIGKSSLVRAGLIPPLCEGIGCEGLGIPSHTLHRYRIVSPTTTNSADPISLLVDALADLGSLKPTVNLADLKQAIADEPQSLATAVIEPVEAEPNHTTQPKFNLLVLDQFEQILIDENCSDAAKANLITCIAWLTQQPEWLVMVMVRNDFYANLLDILGFSELKEQGIHFDLQGPSSGDIAKMIRFPAYAAGLHFECDDDTGERVDDLLLEAATQQPDSLPLLEYTLDLLYQQRSQDNGLLLQVYKQLGGIEGAIVQQAENTFQSLPVSSQQCWNTIMHVMIKSDLNHSNRITAQKVHRNQFTQPAQHHFIQQFIDARLFTTDNQHGEFITIAHEALIQHWQRIKDWVEDNRHALHTLTLLTQDCQRWLDDGQNYDLLLSPRKLEDATALASREDVVLNSEEREFIQQSAGRATRKHRVTRIMQGAFVGLFSVITVLAIVANYQSNLANEHLATATQEKSKAEGLIDYMLGDLKHQLEPIGKLDIMQGVGEKTLTYYRDTPNGGQLQQANSLLLLAQINIDKNALGLAQTQLQQALQVLADYSMPQHPDYLYVLGHINYYLGLIPYLRQELEDVETYWQAYLQSAKQLSSVEPKTLRSIEELGSAYHNMGALAFEQGDYTHATQYLDRSLASALILAQQHKDSYDYLSSYIDTFNWVSDLHFHYGNIDKAVADATTVLALAQPLLSTEPVNYEFVYTFINSLNLLVNKLINTNRLEQAAALLGDYQNQVNEFAEHDKQNLQWQVSAMLFESRRVEVARLLNKTIPTSSLLVDIDSTPFLNQRRLLGTYMTLLLHKLESSSTPLKVKNQLDNIVFSDTAHFIMSTTPRILFQLSQRSDDSARYTDLLARSLPQLTDATTANIFVVEAHYYLALLQNRKDQATELFQQLAERGYHNPYVKRALEAQY